MKILGEKILASILAIIIIFVILFVFCFTKISTIEKNIDLLIEKELDVLSLEAKMSNDFQSQFVLVNTYIVTGDESYKKEYFEMKKESEKNVDLFGTLNGFTNNLQKQTLDWYNQVENAVFSEYIEDIEDVRTNDYVKEFLIPQGETLSSSHIALVNGQQEVLSKVGNDLVSKKDNLVTGLKYLSVFAVIASLIVTFIMARQIRKFNASY